MLEPSFGDIRRRSLQRFRRTSRQTLARPAPRGPFRRRASCIGRYGSVPLLAGAGVSVQVDVDSPGVPAPVDVAVHTRQGTPGNSPSEACPELILASGLPNSPSPWALLVSNQ